MVYVKSDDNHIEHLICKVNFFLDFANQNSLYNNPYIIQFSVNKNSLYDYKLCNLRRRVFYRSQINHRILSRTQHAILQRHKESLSTTNSKRSDDLPRWCVGVSVCWCVWVAHRYQVIYFDHLSFHCHFFANIYRLTFKALNTGCLAS